MTKMYRRLNYGLLVLATMLSMEPPGSRAFQLSVAGLQPFEARSGRSRDCECRCCQNLI